MEEESAVNQNQKIHDEKSQHGYEFVEIPVSQATVYPNFKTKESKEAFFKWGLSENLEVAKYRFNKSFNLIGAEIFLKDLFNSR